MDQEQIKNFIEEYGSKREQYKNFSIRLKNIIEDILNVKGLSYLSVECRAKSSVSLEKKLEKLSFESLGEVQDLAGVRIITYVYKDIETIESVIAENFLAEQLSVEDRLGTDRVGYRSHHWLISLPDNRLKLPEYEQFGGLKAELQISTVLQHAWAQIGHKQVYKPSAILPRKIKRNFTLLSGLLEIADNEFNRISNEILEHQQEVVSETEKGNLEIPIDTVSLRQYFDTNFKSINNMDPRFGPHDDMAEDIIEELRDLGITTLAQLDNIIPKDFMQNLASVDMGEKNYCGLSRNIMVIYNYKEYFEKAWKNKWVSASKSESSTGELYKIYGIDYDEIIKTYGLRVSVKK
ncbi:MAG: hypothetical protein KBC81_03050 [Candidatus Pacebacteria bacterium]|nr:hypothetical protein [Candidatus Paceibacterota bacterium]